MVAVYHCEAGDVVQRHRCSKANSSSKPYKMKQHLKQAPYIYALYVELIETGNYKEFYGKITTRSLTHFYLCLWIKLFQL